MNNFKVIFSTTLIFTIIFLGNKKYHNFNLIRNLKKDEKIRLKKSAEILNECLDLENKSKRKLHESISLIEFCLKEHGSLN